MTSKRQQELRDRHAEELAKLEREETAAAMLPEGVVPNMVHFYRLYDRCGTFRFGDTFPSSIREPFTLADALAIAEKLPPALPLAIYRDTCLGIRTYDNALEAQGKAVGGAEVTRLSPFVFRADPRFGCVLQSCHRMPNGEVWDVNFCFPHVPQTVGVLRTEWTNPRLGQPVPREATWHYAPETTTIHRGNDTVAFAHREISYGAGEPGVAGPRVANWIDVGTGAQLVDFLRAVRPEPTGEGTHILP